MRFANLGAGKFIQGLHCGFAGGDRVPSELKLDGDLYKAANEDHPQRDKPGLGSDQRRGNQLTWTYDRCGQDQSGAEMPQ